MTINPWLPWFIYYLYSMDVCVSVCVSAHLSNIAREGQCFKEGEGRTIQTEQPSKGTL